MCLLDIAILRGCRLMQDKEPELLTSTLNVASCISKIEFIFSWDGERSRFHTWAGIADPAELSPCPGNCISSLPVLRFRQNNLSVGGAMRGPLSSSSKGLMRWVAGKIAIRLKRGQWDCRGKKQLIAHVVQVSAALLLSKYTNECATAELACFDWDWERAFNSMLSYR
jgi:hypothetical protein